jgi:hypothetical protein
VAGSLAVENSTYSPGDPTLPEHGLSHSGVLPILDIGSNYILGQTFVNNSFSAPPPGGPIQCGPDKECLDKLRCNSDGKCGFREYHCKPKDPVKCISNCDAKAMCGVDSKDGNKKCGLNLCCSYYGKESALIVLASTYISDQAGAVPTQRIAETRTRKAMIHHVKRATAAARSFQLRNAEKAADPQLVVGTLPTTSRGTPAIARATAFGPIISRLQISRTPTLHSRTSTPPRSKSSLITPTMLI